MKNKTVKIISIVAGVLALLAAISALTGIYFAFREKSTAGKKNIIIEVVNADEETIKYTVTTDAKYLEGAMNDAKGLTYETDDGMVMVINGIRADYVLDGAYWGFYINDSYCNYGIADQPINDNDHFRIVYTKA